MLHVVEDWTWMTLSIIFFFHGYSGDLIFSTKQVSIFFPRLLVKFLYFPKELMSVRGTPLLLTNIVYRFHFLGSFRNFLEGWINYLLLTNIVYKCHFLGSFRSFLEGWINYLSDWRSQCFVSIHFLMS